LSIDERLDDRLAALSPAKRKLLFERLVAQAARQEAGPAPLVPVPHEGPQPLSFGQQQLWLVDQLALGGSAYNIPAAVSLEGSLDPASLAAALAGVVARHEVLRTSYAVVDGEPRQLVQDEAAVPLPLLDLSALNEKRHAEEAARVARAEHARPFDLERAPMLRAALLRLGEERHVLLLTLHHIAADGWSIGVLTRELGALYEASPLPVLPVQYADFALHQRRHLQGETLEALTGWWRERLFPPPPTLPLPFDRPRQIVASSRGGRRTLELGRELEAALERLARQRSATLFAVLLATLQTLLARLTGEADIAVGTPVAGRDRPEVEPLIGYFVNVLVLRSPLPASLPFAEAVERARQASVAAWSHAELPFERLVDALEPERSLAVTPFFQVLFTLQNAPLPRLELPGLALAPLDLPDLDSGEAAKFDLSLSVAPVDGEGLTLIATYRAALFDPPTVQRLLGTWATLLAAAAADPEQRLSDLPLLSAAERHQLVREWNDSAAAVPGVPRRAVHELFREQAAQTPGRTAFMDGDGTTVTYRDLAARAEDLAAELIRRGLEPEDRVALLLPNGLDFLTAVLGLLAAGGAYLPLDPDLPAERRDFIVADARVSVVLTTPLPSASTHGPRVGGGASPPGRVDGREWGRSGGGQDSAAYVLYTSGSTGRPKGVTISHGALVNFLAWVNRDLPGGTRPMPWISSPGFDASLKQFLAPLLRGDAVWLPASGPARLAALPEELAARPGATLNCVPSLWRVLLDEVQAASLPSTLGHLLLGGEAVDAQLVEKTFTAQPALQIWNLYGPTETTSIAAIGRIGRIGPGRTAIGRPISNVRLSVLDRLLTPLPLGVAGELCIGGAGVARGYLDRPDLTAERFVPDPLSGMPGARLYRTGDLVRNLPDGALEYLGRLDRQVKLRGVRIELEEIERTLGALPEVRESAVVLWNDRLVAYLVPAQEKEVDPAAVRRFLEERLPAAMVPADLVLLPELPRTPSGKTDRPALPAPSVAGTARRAAFVPPRNATEARLAEVWRQVLGVEQVGIHDSFFELGGDSLLAVRVAARARQEGIPLDMGRIFQYTTILALAEALDEALDEAEPATASAMSGGEDAPPPSGEMADDFPDAELSPRDLENLLTRFER
jgi:amino acid adenylation domain-containing protein